METTCPVCREPIVYRDDAEVLECPLCAEQFNAPDGVDRGAAKTPSSVAPLAWIAHDSHLFGRTCRELLERAGYEVRHFYDGGELARATPSTAPQLVFLEAHLPLGSPRQIVAAMHALQPRPLVILVPPVGKAPQDFGQDGILRVDRVEQELPVLLARRGTEDALDFAEESETGREVLENEESTVPPEEESGGSFLSPVLDAQDSHASEEEKSAPIDFNAIGELGDTHADEAEAPRAASSIFDVADDDILSVESISKSSSEEGVDRQPDRPPIPRSASPGEASGLLEVAALGDLKTNAGQQEMPLFFDEDESADSKPIVREPTASLSADMPSAVFSPGAEDALKEEESTIPPFEEPPEELSWPGETTIPPEAPVEAATRIEPSEDATRPPHPVPQGPPAGERTAIRPSKTRSGEHAATLNRFTSQSRIREMDPPSRDSVAPLRQTDRDTAPPSEPTPSTDHIASSSTLRAGTASRPEAWTAAQRTEHEKAQRLARIIVGDIALYNKDRMDAAIRNGQFFEVLKNDIRDGRRYYRERVSEEIRRDRDYLQEGFEALIATKEVELGIRRGER